MNHAAFACVVADLTVILAVQLLASTIGGALHRRLPGTALYLSDVEVIQRQSLTVLGQHALDFGQVEDTLDQLVKLAIAHVFDHWCNALYRCPARYEPVASLLALAVLEILYLLFDTLVAVLGLP